MWKQATTDNNNNKSGDYKKMGASDMDMDMVIRPCRTTTLGGHATLCEVAYQGTVACTVA